MFPNIGNDTKVTKVALGALQLGSVHSVKHTVEKYNVALVAFIEPTRPPLDVQNTFSMNNYGTKGMIRKSELFQ
jgi:hypothetical protein